MRISAAQSAVIALMAAGIIRTGPATAQDDMANNALDAIGVPMPVNEAVGAWTVKRADIAICRLTMSAQKLGPDFYGAKVPQDCDSVIPAGAAGWKPVTDGLAFVDGDGRILIDFNRWTPTSLSTPSSGGVINLVKAN